MTFFESSSRSIFLFEHDLRADASRLSRGKTGTQFSGSCWLLFQKARPDIHRCGAVEPSKAAVEIGKVAKASVVGDRADLLFPRPGLAEHAVGAGKAPAEQEG